MRSATGLWSIYLCVDVVHVVWLSAMVRCDVNGAGRGAAGVSALNTATGARAG